MRKISSVTDTADSNGEFTDGNVANGISPTILSAGIFNTWQRELVNIVESAGITLSNEDDGQILKAIQDMFGAGRFLGQKVFTANGVYIPSPLVKSVRVILTGGGGGGGGCQASNNNETFSGAGGGAGGTVISWVNLDTSNSYIITVGAGGDGASGADSGRDGGTSSFANLFSAPGGEGGIKAAVSNTAGGAGGAPSTGDIKINGGAGSDGQASTVMLTGNGGGSYFGGGGRAGSGGGVRGTAPGSGGGGAYDLGYSSIKMMGGGGASGIVIIEEYS